MDITELKSNKTIKQKTGNTDLKDFFFLGMDGLESETEYIQLNREGNVADQRARVLGRK